VAVGTDVGTAIAVRRKDATDKTKHRLRNWRYTIEDIIKERIAFCMLIGICE